MHSPAGAVLLALAVTLAGCGGFVGSSSPDATDATSTSTKTPAPSPGQVVPGVTEDGVTGPLALAEAHADVLRNHSYTANETRTLRLANGTVVSRTHRFSAVNGSRALFKRRQYDAYNTFPFPEMTQWQDGTESALRLVGPNGSVQYRRSVQLSMLHTGASDWYTELYGYLGAGSFAVTGSVVRDGEVLYRIESTEPFEVVSFDVAGGNASMWLLVDGRGLVHEYHVSMTGTRGGERVRRIVHVRFTNVGSTTVERPAWVAEARNETA